MRRALTILLALAPLPAPAADRVASAGLCADQVVVPLVERDRIVGVSPQASDAALSLVADQAQGLPVRPASAEGLILAKADLVVMNTYGDGKTKALLEKLGVRVVRVPYDDSLDSIPRSLRTLGAALDASPRAAALAEDFTRRLEAVKASRRGPPMLAAYYRPDGGSAGKGTYVAEAMAAAGYDSLYGRLGQTGWGRLELEALVLNPPEAVVASFFERDQSSIRRVFGRHPVFRGLLASVPVIAVPGRMWGCGGWPLVVATEHMAALHPKQVTP